MAGISARKDSRLIAPRRKTTGIGPVQSTTVDSRPTVDRSPFRIHAMSPSRSSTTDSQLVGLGLPDLFADGAATGRPHAVRKL